jgi:hypothetical protein
MGHDADNRRGWVSGGIARHIRASKYRWQQAGGAQEAGIEDDMEGIFEALKEGALTVVNQQLYRGRRGQRSAQALWIRCGRND